MPKTVILDKFDRALLAQMQTNNLLPARTLAGRVGLSESAVLRRMKRLRRDRVISADISVVHPTAMGLSLTMHVLVSLEREGSAALDAFTRKIRGRSEVRQAWYVTGETDFVLLLQVPGMDVYESFAREVFHDDPNVKAFKTIVTIREVVGIAEAKPYS